MSPRTRRLTLGFVAIAVAACSPIIRASEIQTASPGPSPTGERAGDETFLHRAIADPLAVFTLVLVLFTGALAVGTFQLVSGADETARRQLRAYVSLRRFKTTYSPLSEGGNIVVCYVAPRFENSGLTPARNVQIHVSYQVFEEIPSDFDFADVPVGGLPSFGPIGPRIRMTGSAAPIPRLDVMDIATEGKHGLIWGHVDYDDVFPKSPRRSTKFAAEIVVVGDVYGYDNVIGLRMFERHNDAT